MLARLRLNWGWKGRERRERDQIGWERNKDNEKEEKEGKREEICSTCQVRREGFITEASLDNAG